jgi:hypothetical protein
VLCLLEDSFVVLMKDIKRVSMAGHELTGDVGEDERIKVDSDVPPLCLAF